MGTLRDGAKGGTDADRFLVGRAVELTTIDSALRRAQGGRGQTLFIEGEGGIGKTSLLQEAISRARRTGFQIWTGAAGELERDRPFGPLIDALHLDRGASDPSRAEIETLLSASGPTAGSDTPSVVVPEFRERLIEDIVALVEGAATDRPAVLAVEDIHWADPSTLASLRRVIRRSKLARLVVMASFRPSPEGDQLVRDAPDAHHISLGPLDAGRIELLVAHLIDAIPGPRLLSEIARTGGNPLFITELIAALEADELITKQGGVAEFEGGKIPESMGLLILRRLSFLSNDALDVLRLAATLGITFSIRDLSTVSKRPASDLMRVLQEAFAVGLLSPADDHIAWRHDLVRDAIYHDLPLSMRKALHMQCAHALGAADADVLKVAAQFSLGASERDEEALNWLRRAAREAAPRDAAIQTELLDRALELAPADYHELAELEVERAGGLLWCGRVADAEEVCRAVLGRRPVPQTKDAARSLLSLALFFQNRMGEAGAEFEAASKDPETPESSRLGLLAQAAMGYLQGGNPERALELAQDVISAGEKVGDHFAAAIGCSVLAWINYFSSNVAESIDLQRRGLAHAELDTTGEANRRHPFLIPGLMLLEGDLLDEAADSFRDGLELGEQLGIVWHTPLYHFGIGTSHLYPGRWDDMRAEWETAWDVAAETGSMWGSVAFRSFSAWASVHRDDLADAERLLEEAHVVLDNQGATMESVWTFWADAALLEAKGRLEEALAVFTNGWDLFNSLGMMVAHRLLGPDLTRLAVAAGDGERATAVAAQVEEHARRADVPSARGAALQCRGLATDDPDVLLDSVAEYRRSPRVVHLGFACEDAGKSLLRHGRNDEARAHFQEAFDIYGRVQMRRCSNRVEARLRSLGVRKGARGPRSGRPQHGWESLTTTEARVASLAAEGMTNPQIAERLFISRRTVETHMSRVLRKLDLGSRVELAAAAARRSTA